MASLCSYRSHSSFYVYVLCGSSLLVHFKWNIQHARDHVYFENLLNQRVLKLHTIKLGSIEITVTKKKIKNLRMSVSPTDGRIRISSPLRASDEYIKSFALSRIGWIEKQQKKFQSQGRPPLLVYVSGESPLLLIWIVSFLNGELSGII
jgi:hypothetical protein